MLQQLGLLTLGGDKGTSNIVKITNYKIKEIVMYFNSFFLVFFPILHVKKKVVIFLRGLRVSSVVMETVSVYLNGT